MNLALPERYCRVIEFATLDPAVMREVLTRENQTDVIGLVPYQHTDGKGPSAIHPSDAQTGLFVDIGPRNIDRFVRCELYHRVNRSTAFLVGDCSYYSSNSWHGTEIPLA